MSESAAKSLPDSQPSPAPITSRLVSLAILKENWNQGKTYLDNFVPFVVECLRDASGPKTSAEIQERLRTIFRIRVPLGVVDTLMHKAARQGYADREDNAYAPRPDKLAEVELMAPRQQELLRVYAALSGEMKAFAKAHFNLDVNETDASNALDAYVNEFGAETVVHGCAPEVQLRAVREPGLDYVAHAFVESLSRTNPTSFGYFETLVQGSMLASIVYLPNAESTDQRFRDETTIFLDTPFVLRALGFVGPEQQAPAVELIELLRESRATVACFEATVEEVRGVVVAAMPPVGGGVNQSTSEVARYFRSRGLKRGDLQLRADNLKKSLSALNVKVRSTPPFKADWSVDEKALEAALDQRVHYARGGARRHDLDALTAVHRLREGRRPPMLENARAIFLTTNASLVAASRDFFQAEAEDANHAWPHAMLDTNLATLVWLKQPQRAPDLPRKQILADCYAALHPGERMWNRWLAEIQRTAASGEYSDDDLDIMRFSPDAQRALMDVTLGEESAIDERTVPQVLASAEETITAPVRTQLAAQRKALEHSEAARLAAEARADEAEVATAAARKMYDQRQERRHQRLRDRAQNTAKKVSLIVFWVLVSVAAISLVWTVIGLVFPGLSAPAGVKPFLVVAGIIGALGTFVHFVFGWSATKVAQKSEHWFADRLHRRSLRRLGEDEPIDAG